MIEPTCYDITIPKGATYNQDFTWKDDFGNIYDLSAYTARMQIRLTVNATGTPILSLTTSNGGITLSGTDPNIRLYISDAATTAVTIATGYYDLELIAPNLTVSRLLQGKVKFSPEVTR